MVTHFIVGPLLVFFSGIKILQIYNCPKKLLVIVKNTKLSKNLKNVPLKNLEISSYIENILHQFFLYFYTFIHVCKIQES